MYCLSYDNIYICVYVSIGFCLVWTSDQSFIPKLATSDHSIQLELLVSFVSDYCTRFELDFGQSFEVKF
jgi:hypothetical protein